MRGNVVSQRTHRYRLPSRTLALVAASMCTAAISSLEGSAVIADYVFRFRSISGGYASLQWLSRTLSTSRGPFSGVRQ
jgi:hypothetical protein